MPTAIAANQLLESLRRALSTHFPSEKVDEVLLHYNVLRREARVDHYDNCLVSGGKFVEAALKCLHFKRTGEVIDSVSVDAEINRLVSAPQIDTLDTSEKLAIPHTLRIIYYHRNKRGGAHNSSFDPSKMDCTLVVAAANWVMEELARLYLTNDPVAAQTLISNLLVKELPLVEEIDGDYLILEPDTSARVQLELILYAHYSSRCSTEDLVRWIHNHSANNVRTTLRNMKTKNLVHENESGWKLTTSGVHEAEIEIMKMRNGGSESKKNHTVKAKGGRRGR